MTTLQEAAQQALEALEDHANQYPHMQKGYTVDAITALRAALAEPVTNQCGETCERAKLCAVCARGLAEPVQEPVAWMYEGEPYFDGNEWYIPHQLTQSKELADFKSGTIKKPTALYAAPQQPERKPLTDEEIDGIGGEE